VKRLLRTIPENGKHADTLRLFADERLVVMYTIPQGKGIW
jgi:hypothetical protein